MMTVYLMVSFKDFVKPAADDPANALPFYEVPTGYTEAKLADIFGGKASALDSGEDDDMAEYL